MRRRSNRTSNTRQPSSARPSMRNTKRSSANGKTMRILVTGHKGYIGTVMVPMLLGAGHEVIGLDSELFRECIFSPGIHEVPALRVDVRDVERRHLDGFDAVIHLAALSNDPLGDLDPEITYQINHAAPVRLARLAKEAGVSRFLYSSSCSSYGKAGHDLVD